jgi:hypothetical protein
MVEEREWTVGAELVHDTIGGASLTTQPPQLHRHIRSASEGSDDVDEHPGLGPVVLAW